MGLEPVKHILGGFTAWKASRPADRTGQEEVTGSGLSVAHSFATGSTKETARSTTRRVGEDAAVAETVGPIQLDMLDRRRHRAWPARQTLPGRQARGSPASALALRQAGGRQRNRTADGRQCASTRPAMTVLRARTDIEHLAEAVEHQRQRTRRRHKHKAFRSPTAATRRWNPTAALTATAPPNEWPTTASNGPNHSCGQAGGLDRADHGQAAARRLAVTGQVKRDDLVAGVAKTFDQGAHIFRARAPAVDDQNGAGACPARLRAKFVHH